MPNARARKRIADWADAPRVRELSKKLCVASATVVAGPISRGALTAIMWLWKPASPHKAVANPSEAIDYSEVQRSVEGGVTSMLAVPLTEVIAGHSALVTMASVGDRYQRPEILRAPVVLHVSLPLRPSVGGDAYPSSLMGVTAFVRQAFLDAHHHAWEPVSPAERRQDPLLESMRPSV